MGFQDGHSKEYLEDGGFEQDNSEVPLALLMVPLLLERETEKGGGVVEWLRALDLKSGGPWFKSSTLPLSGFVLGSPEFNSSTALCK